MSKILIVEQSNKKYCVRLKTSTGNGGGGEQPDPEPNPEQPNIPDSFIFGYQGGSQQLTVDHEGDWTIEENGDWFTVSESSGTGDIEVTLTAGENAGSEPRNGSIVLHLSDGTTHTIVISQLFNLVFNYSVSGTNNSTVFIAVNSNTIWEARQGTSPSNITQLIYVGANTTTFGVSRSNQQLFVLIRTTSGIAGQIIVIPQLGIATS